MTSGASDLIEIATILRHETDHAFLVDAGGPKPVWLPKSQVEQGDPDGNCTTFMMPEWLAREKGLI